MVSDGDYIYLPCSHGEKGRDSADSLFYLARFKYTPGVVAIPESVLKYTYANFGEECIARGNVGITPIVLNRVQNIFDFGSGRSIDLNRVELPQPGDTIASVFDFIPMLDGSIKLIALTKNNLTIVAILNSRRMEVMTVLEVTDPPVACAFLPGEQIVT